MKKLIPWVYSSPISPSDLGLYSGVKKESCGSLRRRTKDKDKDGIRWGWVERRPGSERLNWWTLIAVKHTWSTVFSLFSCLWDESCYRLTAGQRLAVSFSTSACLHHPKSRSGSTCPHVWELSCVHSSGKLRCLERKCYNFFAVWFGWRSSHEEVPQTEHLRLRPTCLCTQIKIAHLRICSSCFSNVQGFLKRSRISQGCRPLWRSIL